MGLLFLCRLDLATAYTGVPEQRVLTMRNTAQLPCDYEWMIEGIPGNTGHMGMSITPCKGQLAPGEEVSLAVELQPSAVGTATMFGICHVDAMPQPKGFKVTAHIEGLQVAYQVLPATAVQGLSYSTGDLARISSHALASTSAPLTDKYVRHNASGLKHVAAATASSNVATCNDVGETSPPGIGGGQHSIASAKGAVFADFGQVQIGTIAQLLLLITNLTSMPAAVHAWMGEFPASVALSEWQQQQQCGGTLRQGDQKLANGFTGSQSLPGKQQHPANTSKASKQQQQPERQQQQGLTIGFRSTQRLSASNRSRSCSPNALSSKGTTTKSTSHLLHSKYQPISLSDAHETTMPFRTGKGNQMMAKRRGEQEAAVALGGGGKGLAVAVEPDEGLLQPWSQLELDLVAYNNMCGDYVDTLHVQVST